MTTRLPRDPEVGSMDWQQFAQQFGLPGVMLLAMVGIAKLWIASNEKVELERIKVEDKKADAMASALTSLSGKIDQHHTADLLSHREMGEGIAELKGKLDEAIGWQERTPVGGVPVPRKAQTPPRGVRSPRAGTFHDEDR